MKYTIQPILKWVIALSFLGCLGFAPAMAKLDDIQEAPLYEPAKLNDVEAWGRHALQMIYTYDYANYRHQIEQTAKFFTEEGWSSYTKAFRQSENLRTVIKNNMVVNATVSSRPTVLKQGIKDGIYFWHLQYSVTARYMGADQMIKVPLQITLHIKRTQQEGDRGLGIEAFIAEANKGD